MDSMKSEKLKAKRKRDDILQNIIVHFLTSLTCFLLCSYWFWFPSLTSLVESFASVSLPQWKSLLVNAKTLFLVANLIVVFLIRDSGCRQASKFPSSSPADDLYDEYVELRKRFRGMHANGTEESNLKEERALEVQPETAEDEGDRTSDRGAEFEESLSEERAKSPTDDLKSDEGGESNELPTVDQMKSATADLLDPKSAKGTKSDELPTEDPMKSATADLLDPKSAKGNKSDELAKEELTRRAEEFIARVNKRRWLESKSILIPPI